MFDSFYSCISLGSHFRNPFTDDPDLIRRDIYRFDTETHSFLAEVTCYERSIYIIEYYDSTDKNSRSFSRYGKLLGDVNASKVIRTCFELMLIYLKKDRSASFAFMGAPTFIKGQQVEPFDNTKRFRIYRFVSVNLLGSIALNNLKISIPAAT